MSDGNSQARNPQMDRLLLEFAESLEPRHPQEHKPKYDVQNRKEIKTRLQNAYIPGVGLRQR